MSSFESIVLEALNKILKKKKREEIKNLDDVLKLSLQNDLGLDSLDLAELTVRIENKTGIDIFENKIIRTVEEILDELRQRVR